MFVENYEKILEKISKSSGLSKEELDRRVEAKRAKLSGLISKEGAAQIVAAELGISFDKEKLKINELLPGMKRVNILAEIIGLSRVREFNKNGRSGKVANLMIADDTSNISVVLWDMNHIELIEKGKLKKGDVIDISNAGVRDMEVHLGSFSELKLSSEKLETVKSEIVAREKSIDEFKVSRNIKTRAFIVQIFDPRSFEVCPECGKKPSIEGDGTDKICGEHGKIIPQKRFLINIVIDDGNGSIRGVLFHEAVSELGFDTNSILEPGSEVLEKQKQELLGKEMVFYGDVRQNKIFNNLEFVINKVEEINLDELIGKLEKSEFIK